MTTLEQLTHAAEAVITDARVLLGQQDTTGGLGVLLAACSEDERLALEQGFDTGARCLIALLMQRELLDVRALLAAYPAPPA